MIEFKFCHGNKRVIVEDFIVTYVSVVFGSILLDKLGLMKTSYLFLAGIAVSLK